MLSIDENKFSNKVFNVFIIVSIIVVVSRASLPYHDNKFDIVVKINFNNKTKIYENNAVLINFFPVLIFSSSPKLNFFIKAPVATEIPAAGVASANSQDCMLSNAFCNFEINIGYAA